MTFSLGFSPCPNDTFIFDALVNGKIDTGGLQFDVHLEDVQTLNEYALSNKLSITKLSYAVLPMVLEHYALMDSGSALGKGVGPLLIANEADNVDGIEEKTIAIPGKHTTAHLLFSLKYPGAKKKVFLRYDEIEAYVKSGAGPGVIIHENRFTYQQRGFKKITDLGDFWESQTGVPIPLGGIVIGRNIDVQVQQKIQALIKESIAYAFSQYPEVANYVKLHAQEMSESVMRSHIDLYVNNYSLSLGNEGRKAIHVLMDIYAQLNNISLEQHKIFVD